MSYKVQLYSLQRPKHLLISKVRGLYTLNTIVGNDEPPHSADVVWRGRRFAVSSPSLRPTDRCEWNRRPTSPSSCTNRMNDWFKAVNKEATPTHPKSEVSSEDYNGIAKNIRVRKLTLVEPHPLAPSDPCGWRSRRPRRYHWKETRNQVNDFTHW